MADTESILQLGIEATRAGDKEEARNLFRLLTRESPQDPQAWLWLAGVAEDREEKRAALEQVIQLDPSNELAKQGLAALGGPSRAARAAVPPPPPPAPEPEPVVDDDLNFDWQQPTTSNDFALPEPDPIMAPAAPAASAPPARTRDLTPDEEFAMSLDSFGSLSNSYNERSKSGSDVNSYNIPDFGDDEELDLNAYMNRERVDMSQIEVTAEEGKKPVRKAISKGGISDEAKARYKEKKPKVAGAPRASGGWLPLLLGVLVAGAFVFLLWNWSRGRNNNQTPIISGGTTFPTAGVAGQGGIAQATPGGDGAVPTLNPGGAVIDPNAVQPTLDPNQPAPTPVDPNQPQPQPAPPINNGGGTPDAVLAELGGAQPNLLPAGVTPVVVDGWYVNYNGISTIADGNVIGVQPTGRWVQVGVLMNNATDTGQVRGIPGELLVLKDAQGRVYRANADASEAYFNANPGAFNYNQKQEIPFNSNIAVPLLFDVSADATDLVLFSPLKTDQGYLVRNNAN